MALMSNKSLHGQTRRLSDTFHQGAALFLRQSLELLPSSSNVIDLYPWSFLLEAHLPPFIFPVFSPLALSSTFLHTLFTSPPVFFSPPRCCRTAPRPAGRWSSTGGRRRAPTSCESSTSTRTFIKAESVC